MRWLAIYIVDNEDCIDGEKSVYQIRSGFDLTLTDLYEASVQIRIFDSETDARAWEPT